MKSFYYLVLGITLLSSTTLSLEAIGAKNEQKPTVKQETHRCPEGKAYCCTGQNAEGFDNCGCFSVAECAEADNN